MALTHPKLKVAAVQAAPAFLDLDASVEKPDHQAYESERGRDAEAGGSRVMCGLCGRGSRGIEGRFGLVRR